MSTRLNGAADAGPIRRRLSLALELVQRGRDLPRFSRTCGPRRVVAVPVAPPSHTESPARHAAHVREVCWPFTGGTSGGTLGGKDQEIRVRTGKFIFQAQMRHNAPSGVLCKACVEKKPVILAPQVGFEPTTLRLTAGQLHQNTAT